MPTLRPESCDDANFLHLLEVIAMPTSDATEKQRQSWHGRQSNNPEDFG